MQADILRLVSRESEAGRPANLFTVGDVKQSIYRFRLAEPMLFFGAAASGSVSPASAASPLTSVENFRSRTPVLDAINAVMERLMAADLGGIDYDDLRDCAPARAKITVRR